MAEVNHFEEEGQKAAAKTRRRHSVAAPPMLHQPPLGRGGSTSPLPDADLQTVHEAYQYLTGKFVDPLLAGEEEEQDPSERPHFLTAFESLDLDLDLGTGSGGCSGGDTLLVPPPPRGRSRSLIPLEVIEDEPHSDVAKLYNISNPSPKIDLDLGKTGKKVDLIHRMAKSKSMRINKQTSKDEPQPSGSRKSSDAGLFGPAFNNEPKAIYQRPKTPTDGAAIASSKSHHSLKRAPLSFHTTSTTLTPFTRMSTRRNSMFH